MLWRRLWLTCRFPDRGQSLGQGSRLLSVKALSSAFNPRQYFLQRLQELWCGPVQGAEGNGVSLARVCLMRNLAPAKQGAFGWLLLVHPSLPSVLHGASSSLMAFAAMTRHQVASRGRRP
jgi:hypothetical protein